jgi:uncharacterized damage-inducible protein DinB
MGMSNERLPEPWLRGPVESITPQLQPVAYALIAVREEAEAICAAIKQDELWARPSGVASIGYHLRHLAGATDRLLTYARGENLSDSQIAAMKLEKQEGEKTAAELFESMKRAVDSALQQLRATSPDDLYEKREVGRAKLPSTVIGLLFHAAEHAQRHAGQITTTFRFVRKNDL